MARSDRLAQAFVTGALAPPAAGDSLVIRATSPALAEVFPPASLLFEQSFRPAHDALEAAGLRVTRRANGPAAMVLVTLTRARGENLGNVARALEVLPPGAVIALDGARTDGIESLARQVGAVIPLEGSFAKSHGKVVWLRRPPALPAAVADWAAAGAPTRNAAGFMAAPGLFSPDGPDAGSQRLAQAFAGKLRGRVADLGAGWGWLSATALAHCPDIAAIDLFEAEGLALDAARTNLADPRAGFHWVDVRTLRRDDAGYDAVIANPPFHHGRAAEPELGAGFIAASARLLKPSGRLWLVANRQLPYEAALDAAFARWDKLSEDGAFKVIVADKPRRT